MGTNFYFVSKDSHRLHIGKRSAAGFYCWDCNMTLHRDGFHEYPNPNIPYWSTDRKGVHFNDNWSKTCLNCGKPEEDEPGWNSAAGRELGFNKEKPHKKTGVKTASTFSWAIRPSFFFRNRNRKIRDDYGKEYTFRQFLEVLDECPMWTYENIGHDFS
jgi:hypothetical protein